MGNAVSTEAVGQEVGWLEGEVVGVVVGGVGRSGGGEVVELVQQDVYDFFIHPTRHSANG